MKNYIWKLPYDMRRFIYNMVCPGTLAEYSKLRKTFDEKNSLKPFIDREAIFVHIPKTAGISVCEALFGSLAGGHRRIKEYLIAFSEKEFNAYFKFSFVRHPCDRLCSAFWYLKGGGMSEEDRRWGEEVFSEFASPNEFVNKWLHADRLHECLHFVPQYEFLCLTGSQPMVDYLGRFESLNSDFKFIAEKIGLDVELGHLNLSKRKSRNWRDQLDSNAVAKIENLYERDFELFKYEI